MDPPEKAGIPVLGAAWLSLGVSEAPSMNFTTEFKLTRPNTTDYDYEDIDRKFLERLKETVFTFEQNKEY